MESFFRGCILFDIFLEDGREEIVEKKFFPLTLPYYTKYLNSGHPNARPEYPFSEHYVSPLAEPHTLRESVKTEMCQEDPLQGQCPAAGERGPQMARLPAPTGLLSCPEAPLCQAVSAPELPRVGQAFARPESCLDSCPVLLPPLSLGMC